MIKNILFDLGGVIMNIRRENCIEAFKKLGMPNPDDFLGDYVQQGPFKGVEDGSVTAAEFRDEIRKFVSAELTDKQIDDAFSEFLIGIPTNRLRELDELHKHYRICMLSNTNPIMWNGKIAKEFKKDGHDVDFYFDRVALSFEAKSMKPDKKAFQYAIKQCDIVPDETIFLDDSQANLDAASEMGFHTLLVPPGTEFYPLLKKRLGL